MAQSSAVSQHNSTTETLLARQADLIRKVAGPDETKYKLPVYKPSEQIKQEKYDLKHTKSFMRVLKMHQVMPRMLRKATEPPVCMAKNYAIDVDQKIRAAHDEFKQWKSTQEKPLFTGFSTDSSSSLSEGGKFDTLGRTSSLRKQETAKTRMTKANSFAKRKLLSKSTAKKKALPSQLPMGAQIILDKELQKQINLIDAGRSIDSTNLMSRLGTAVMNRVNKKAQEDFQTVKRKLSFSRGMDISQEEKDAMLAEYLRVTNVVSTTQQSQQKMRPRDHIELIKKKKPKARSRSQFGSAKSSEKGGSSTNEPLPHRHYVKMSFDQLPQEIKQKVVTYQNCSESSPALVNFASNSMSSSKSILRQNSGQVYLLAQNSFTRIPTRKMTTQVKGKFKSDQAGSIELPKAQVQIYEPEDEINMQLKEIDEEVLGGQQQQEQLKHLFEAKNISQTSHCRRNKWLESTVESSQAQYSAGFVDQNRPYNAKSSFEKKRASFNAIHGRKNDSLAQNKYKYSKGRTGGKSTMFAGKGQSMSQVSLKSSLNTDLKGRSGEPHPYMHHQTADVSNFSAQSNNKNNRLHSRQRKQRARNVSTISRHVMDRKTTVDQLPVRISHDQFIVKQEFRYKHPQSYRIKFADIAIYATGCLSCGNENVSVENYNERYCCFQCQKTLQTPAGETVSLRANHDGRRIIANAMRYNKPVKGIKVDIDNLRIKGGHRCHATFAGDKCDIIVLMDEVNPKLIYN